MKIDRRFRTALLSLAAAGLSTAAFGAPASKDVEPTYAQDVRPIFERSCVNCHRSAGLNLGGMVAPMSLATYDEVRPWARSIAKAVTSREMPPWHASPVHHGVFANERTLSEAEIETIVQWAKSGAARGDRSSSDLASSRDESQAKTIPDGWSIGKPDLIATMKEPFVLPDEVQDLYVDIEVPLPEEVTDGKHWIKAVEFKPGSSAVHHLIAYAVKPGGSKYAQEAQIGGMAPGNGAQVLPEGHGRLIPKGSHLVFEMHYAKEPGPGSQVEDVSQMAVVFQKEPIRHRVSSDGVANWTFAIPPGAPNHEVRAEHEFAKDVTILSYIPHMHLRGKAARYVAHYPDGSKELLLEVDRYDFNWQTAYEYREPKKLPAGTRLEVTMWYDNSADNANNPDPTVAVSYGEPTVDEMMIGYLAFTNTSPDDLELESLFPVGLWDDLAGTSSLSEN